MIKNIYILILSSLLFFSCNTGMEDQPKFTGSISGTIFNEYDQYINDFKVSIKSENGDILPDTITQSSFDFRKLPIGSHVLMVEAENYITAIEEVNVETDLVTDVEIVMKVGNQTMAVSDSLFYVSAPADSIKISLLSNSDWALKSQNEWLEASTIEGGGNGDVYVKWKSNPLDKIREGKILAKAGNLTKTIKVIQDYDPTILSTKGIPGNHVNQIPDSVRINFDKNIKIIGVKSHYDYCQTEMKSSSNDLKNEVSFSYGCARLGATYDFTVTVQDSLGRNTNHEFSVDFFDDDLAIDGHINEHFIDEVNKSYWVFTDSPNRVYQISTETFKIKQFIDVPFNLNGFSINPYNNRIYIYSSYSPEIYIYAINGGQLIKKVTVPKNSWDHPQHPHINPREIKFSKNGVGIILAVATGMSGNTIKVIDSRDNDRVYNPPSFFEYYNGFREYINQDVESLETNYDLSKIYLAGRHIDDVLWFNPYTLNFESFNVEVSTDDFFTSRRDNFILNYFISELSLINPETGVEIKSQINGRSTESADFSYKDNSSMVLYTKTSESKVVVIDFSSLSKKTSIDAPYYLGGLMATLDGEFLIANNPSSNYDPGTTKFTSHIYRFSTKIFR
ncbi:hypothetical protein [Echinicola sp. 20G]|uniref:hypothetical protein n=1 Tax=Echinicola sp. 20G TaxID=2781961 RepID=UPI00191052F0|nr:hypothetical protein [Echinicola sp. 20G]